MLKESIDVLAERLKTPAWLLAGAKIRKGWVVGTQITQTEFEAGLESFKNAPTHADLVINPLVEGVGVAGGSSAPVELLTQTLQARQDADAAKLEAEKAEAKAKLEAEETAKLEADKTAKTSKGGSR